MKKIGESGFFYVIFSDVCGGSRVEKNNIQGRGDCAYNAV